MNEMLWGGLASSLATALGAVPVLFMRNLSHRGQDIILAFTAGIMVSASMYSLIPTALELSNLWVLGIGLLLGTAVLTLLEKVVPHVDLEHAPEARSVFPSGMPFERKSILFLTAMTLHNLPEGLSVGVSYASGQADLGPVVAISMGLQNAPEGFLVAMFLVMQKVKRSTSLLFACATGLLEFVCCVIGYELTAYVTGLIPYGLAFAGGAMLFIVYKELIPESHGHGYERSATFAFIVGLLLMIVMSEVLGG